MAAGSDAQPDCLSMGRGHTETEERGVEHRRRVQTSLGVHLQMAIWERARRKQGRCPEVTRDLLRGEKGGGVTDHRSSLGPWSHKSASDAQEGSCPLPLRLEF